MARLELLIKEWTAMHDGHSIRVRNSWTGGMQLYVDGECRASTTKLFALNKTRPVLRYELPPSTPGSFVIEVFAYALLTMKAKIVVDGHQIAGDRF